MQGLVKVGRVLPSRLAKREPGIVRYDRGIHEATGLSPAAHYTGAFVLFMTGGSVLQLSLDQTQPVEGYQGQSLREIGSARLYQ